MRLGQAARLQQADRVDPQEQVVHGLADLAVADLAEMGVVGAEAAVDRAAALDHLRPAADQRQQRALVGGEAAAADRRVEHVDALRAGALVERLDGVGLGGRGHRDDRSGRERGEQPVRSEHHLVHLVVVADADDHEIGGARHLGGRLRRRGAGVARLGELLLVDVAGRHRMAVLDQMLEHGQPHPPDADDTNSFLGRCVRHDVPVRQTLALSMAASGLPGSASSPASTGSRRSINRRATAMSRCALIPAA